MLEIIDIIWILCLNYILGHKTISYKDVVGTGKKQLNFSEVDLKAATEYAAEDADVTLRFMKFYQKELNKKN